MAAAEAQVEAWKQEHYNALKNLAITGIELEAKQAYAPNIARWQGEKLEELKREALRQAEAEARNAKIERIERRERELEEEIDGLVKSRNPHLILKAAQDLGLNVTEGGKGRSDGLGTQTPKPRGGKRTASGQTVSAARGRSPSRTPTQTPRANMATLCDMRRAPSGTPIDPPIRADLAEVLSRVASPEPGAQVTADSMHAFRTPVEAYEPPPVPTPFPLLPADKLQEMLEPIALPASFSDKETRGMSSSAFNPANAMEEDTAEAATVATRGGEPPAPADPYAETAVMAETLGLGQKDRALLMLVHRLFSTVMDRLDRVEARHAQPGPRQGKAGAQAGPPTTAQQDGPPPGAGQTRTPPLAPVQPTPSAPSHAAHHADNGIIPVKTWAKVAAPRTGLIISDKAMATHMAASSFMAAAAQVQNRTPAGRLKAGGAPTPARPLTTEVVVIRNGGFEDARREETLRARNPRDIVMEVRTEVERQCRNPIKILSGRWSTTYQKTGNFVYTLAGDVPIPVMVSYKKWLCGPFPDSQIAPTAGWTWAHLRGVPTMDEDNAIFDGEELLKEVQSNTMFAGAILTATPKWQIAPEKLMSTTATVLVAFVDPTGEIAKHALADGVYMFGAQVKFVVSGDKPALIQYPAPRCNAFTAGARTTHPGTASNERANTRLQANVIARRARAPREATSLRPGSPAPKTPLQTANQHRSKGKQKEAPPHQRVDDEEAPYSPSTFQAPTLPPTEEAPLEGPSGRITATVPARRVQPDQPAGGYGTKLIAENEAEDLRKKAAEGNNALVAEATETPHNPPHA
ncbi:hypothetical protein EDB85DRAFT_1892939 [Lactarius pseudohatsudake]|nr:hypothetical protein EDB85DRAFT_1892939 [Lactarius pseudohatsudake]